MSFAMVATVGEKVGAVLWSFWVQYRVRLSVKGLRLRPYT
jgi:hypothetical protein